MWTPFRSSSGFLLAFAGLMTATLLPAQPLHYAVRLKADFERKSLHGTEEIHFTGKAPVPLFKQKNLTVSNSPPRIDLTSGTASFSGRKARFEFEAKPGPGFRWLDDGGLVTMFDCSAWMVCDTGPGYRATLRLELVVPQPDMRAIGPGRLTKQFRDNEGEHFVFEVRKPAQSFLFSFAVARIQPTVSGNLEILSLRPPKPAVFERTQKAYLFFRDKAGIDLPDPHYTQVFLPIRAAGQETSGMALMSHGYMEDIENRDSVELMAHELAHQWWAVLVGIGSWSDFWLNEGIAEFMTAAFVEHHHGRAAYEAKMDALRSQMEKLRAEGKDRPLHWERWRNAVESLGPVPYRKGALFLDRLRRELGDTVFWSGLAIYTRRHAGKLVDSRDFQKAMEQAAGRSLGPLFEEGVYR